MSERRERVIPVDTHTHERPVFVQRHGWQACRHRPSRQAVTHEHMALSFCTGGAVVMDQRGRWSLEAGDVLIVPAGEPHRLLSAQDPEVWGLGFCKGCFAGEGSEELLGIFERVRSGGAAVVRIPAERRAHMEGLFLELQREQEREGGCSAAVQGALVTLVLAEVSRASSDRAALSPANGTVAEALRFIERRCLEPISLGDVARAVRRSPAHVTTLLRRTTGRSVQAWIIARRMSEARRRLTHTDESVEIIAERVGYADATHFIRLFRRAHGVTPAAWRAGNRASEAR